MRTTHHPNTKRNAPLTSINPSKRIAHNYVESHRQPLYSIGPRFHNQPLVAHVTSFNHTSHQLFVRGSFPLQLYSSCGGRRRDPPNTTKILRKLFRRKPKHKNKHMDSNLNRVLNQSRHQLSGQLSKYTNVVKGILTQSNCFGFLVVTHLPIQFAYL